MNAAQAFILGLLPTIITSLVVFYLQRKQRHRDAMNEAHAAASRRESLLMLELQMATAKLSYAVACAIKRGEPNGEVEEGIEAYEAAKARYIAFLNEQAINHLHD